MRFSIVFGEPKSSFVKVAVNYSMACVVWIMSRSSFASRISIGSGSTAGGQVESGNKRFFTFPIISSVFHLFNIYNIDKYIVRNGPCPVLFKQEIKNIRIGKTKKGPQTGPFLSPVVFCGELHTGQPQNNPSNYRNFT